MLPAFLAMALAAAPPPARQEPPDSPGARDIVVVGTKEKPEKEIREFVRALADDAGDEAIPRFDRAAICPAVVGLGAAHNAAVEARMRAVGAGAGVPLAKPGCRPNALVIVAGDKAQTIAALRAAHPVWFRDAYGEEVEVPRQPGPATAWHLEGRLDRSGLPVTYNVERRYYVLNSPTAPSRISVAVRPVLLASVLVVEAKALAGLTTTQVADYAAMRVFAATDPARLKGDPPTILTILDAPMDGDVPATLTQWDLAFLRGLYASPPNQSGRRQRDDIARGVANEAAVARTPKGAERPRD